MVLVTASVSSINGAVNVCASVDTVDESTAVATST